MPIRNLPPRYYNKKRDEVINVGNELTSLNERVTQNAELIASKANAVDIEARLANKVCITYVEEALTSKADVIDIDKKLATKANMADIEGALATKLTIPAGTASQLINGQGQLITPTGTPSEGSTLPFTAGGAYEELNLKANIVSYVDCNAFTTLEQLANAVDYDVIGYGHIGNFENSNLKELLGNPLYNYTEVNISRVGGVSGDKVLKVIATFKGGDNHLVAFKYIYNYWGGYTQGEWKNV